MARFLLFPPLKLKPYGREIDMHRQEAQIAPLYDNLRNFLHDLAQPLATVTGLIDLMLLELDERDKMFQEVRLISQQLEKVTKIVAEIRCMALEAAHQERKALGLAQAPVS